MQQSGEPGALKSSTARFLLTPTASASPMIRTLDVRQPHHGALLGPKLPEDSFHVHPERGVGSARRRRRPPARRGRAALARRAIDDQLLAIR
jgi:hypothetical protein